MHLLHWLGSAFYDARYGARQLRRTPALATAVVLSLAAGVGANTAIFALIDAAILRPLPVHDPSALRIVEWTNAGFPEGAANINGSFRRISATRSQGSSVPAYLYRRLAREQTAVAALLGIADSGPAAVAPDASPAAQASLQYVSANFFQGLGVSPSLGRPFRDEEDRPAAEPVVIVSHRYWTTRLGGATDALGRILRINNTPARVVGIAPPGFFGVRTGQWTDIYAPLSARAAFQAGPRTGAPRGEDDADWWVRQAARLKADVPESAATAQLAALFRNLAASTAAPLDPAKVPQLITLPGRRGFESLNPKDASALWILMLLVGVLLLIVCANVANLLLSRSVGRQRETAVRLALGAGRARLFRQHLIESGVLALLGGTSGLGLGYVLARSIHLLFQTGRDSSSAFDLPLDLRVLAYTAALSLFTALLFGLAPAIGAARAGFGDALKAQTRSITGGRLRLPRILVSVQLALCLAALMAAGLLGRSLRNLQWMDIGFDRENLAYASVNPWQAGYSPERAGPYADHVRDAIARIPGVLRAAAVEIRPLSGNANASRVSLPGRSTVIERGVLNESDAAFINHAGPGFFETLRIPVLLGRAIEARDLRPNAEAVVVDERFARRFFPNQNPLGQRFGFDPKEGTRYEIAGVVRDSRYNSLRGDSLPTVYQPLVPGKGAIHFAIRTTLDSDRLAPAVRAAIASVDPAVPLTEFHTQSDLIDHLLRTERLLGFLSGAFGVLALALSAIGLGGLLAYAVARRTNEIGVRMALGASTTDVLSMVLRDALRMTAAGILLGAPCAYAIARLLGTTLFHLEPLDARTAIFSLLALLAVTLIATLVPARRAARIDPMAALREE